MVNRRRQDRRAYTFTLTMGDVIWACVGAAFALTVFFLFGVLVGRGYVPVEPVETTQSEVSTHGQLEAPSAQVAQEESAPEPAPEAGVLKAEDLAYQDQLEKTGDPEPTPEAAIIADSTDDVKADATKPSATRADTPEESVAAEPVQEGMYNPDALTAPRPGEKVYDYIYQAAALQNQPAAEELAAKLQAKNINAKVVVGKTSSATWYRVQIPFKGTPTQTRTLRAAIKLVTGEKAVKVSKKLAK